MVFLTSIAILLAGCKSADARDPVVDLHSLRQQIYTQPPVKFERATLCKPKASEADETAADLAPIFVLQHHDSAATLKPCPKDSAGESDARAIYTAATAATIHGGEHPQRIFIWWSAPREKEKSTWRGLRITFNPDGLPVVWEVIDPQSPVVQVYVARSLEQKATDKHKEPLPGRRFAIEQPVKDQPHVVVARVLDDGPVPMGPMVYLQPAGDVATVICRCMPSQVAEIDEANYYTLLPIEGACAVTFNDLLATTATESPLFADLADADWLERALRIDSGL